MSPERQELRRERATARELASGTRAGSWARRRGRELRYRFVRRHWKLLVGLTLFAVACSPLFLLIPSSPWRMFALGAWVTASVAFVTHFVIVLSGSVHLTLGDLGEQWTARELKGLEKQGWRVIHHAVLKNGDIDSVLIGPAGVVVLETKGGTTDWSAWRERPRIGTAAKQAFENARIVRLFLKPVIGETRVMPVVVLWPSADLAVQGVEAVTVLPGLELRRWVAALEAGLLDEEQVSRAWQRIGEQVRRRDAHELELHGPGPRAVEEYLFDTVKVVAGFFAGVVAGAEFLRVGWALWGLLSSMAVAAAVAGMRVHRLRLIAAGFFVGVAAFTVFVGATIALFELFR